MLRCAVVAAALVAIALPTGCVRRRLNVRSNPPGAVVFVDNQQIGTTPCSVDFVYYGTREIRLVKPGYETLTVNQPIPTPWYQIPPIDFVSDNLLPNTIQDHRTVAFNLEPQIIVPTEQLIERGNQLRQETLAGVAAGPPGAIVAPGPGAVVPGTTSVPTLAAPESFAPAPTLAPGQVVTPTPGSATQPVPLPPVDQMPMSQAPYGQSPVVQQPFLQGVAPSPYDQTVPPGAAAPGVVQPGTIPPNTLPPTTLPPPTLPPTTTVPSTVPPTTTAPAPFTPPPLQAPAGSTQQGPPIVSPPLR